MTTTETFVQIPLDRLQSSPTNPRRTFPDAVIAELAESIKRHGVLQPILVRPMGNGKHEIIAGERRFRAARLAGLEEVPVIIREVPDEQALALALVSASLVGAQDVAPAEAVRHFASSFTHAAAAARAELDERVGRKAGVYRSQYGASHGVEIADALIAASAHVHGLTLCTRNLRHYPMRDIKKRRV